MKGIINKIRRKRWEIVGRSELKRQINGLTKTKSPIKIILGASHVTPSMDGWVKTDLPQFDITNEEHWKIIFGKNKVNNFLIEHVLEHLTLEQNKIFFAIAKRYLQQQGNIRIAVPDGFHTNPEYINFVKPNGNGPGCEDHKLLWNIDLMNSIASEFNFRITKLEYFDKAGKFTTTDFNDTNGHIYRSYKKLLNTKDIPSSYSSLIVDLTN
jgi:hypothetical protein